MGGIRSAAASCVARCLNDGSRVNAILSTGLTLSLLFAGGFALVSAVAAEPVMRLYSDDAVSVALAVAVVYVRRHPLTREYILCRKI